MRFFLDHDVAADVAQALRQAGHECWSAVEAGLNRASDDDLTVYAMDRRAVLVTHDREFSQRRRRNVLGWHLQLRCHEWEAAELLMRHLDEILRILPKVADVFIVMSASGCELAFGWE